MPVQLFAEQPRSSAWVFYDWLELQQTATVAISGQALIELPALELDELWLVDHMVAGAIGASLDAVMMLYDGFPSLQNLRDGTESGRFDVADWPNGLLVRPGRSLVAHWTGATPGDTVGITLQVRQFRRGAG